MKLYPVVALLSALAAIAFAPAALADPIPITGVLTTANSTELGRASRSGNAQTWLGNESYTGQLNTGITYYYNTYDFSASSLGGNQYVSVDVQDVNSTGDFFVSAFGGSYNPSNRGLNWLGDEGASGEVAFYPTLPGSDDEYFQVIVPSGDDLVLLVNSTLGGTNGLNQPFSLTVQSFSDTNYDNEIDPTLSAQVAQTPEPGSLVLTATGLLGAAGLLRRRRNALRA